MTSGNNPLQEYLDFRAAVGDAASRLFERYAPDLQRRRGCWFCCDEIRVLPIELEALRLWLEDPRSVDRSRHGREVNPHDPEYADLWCELSFSDVQGDEDDARSCFDANGRINMDHIQRRIDALNDEFLLTETGAPYRSLPPGEDCLTLGVLLDPGRIPAGPTPRARRR